MSDNHTIEASPEFAARYELIELLGEGGFGKVFRAIQRSTGQSVAVKILDPGPESGLPPDGRRAARFRREVELCARLHHTHVACLIDAGSTPEGWLYSVFEFVPGRSLDVVLAEEGALEMDEAVYLMGQVLDAIGHAHRHGVLHRDLKPSNIMITEDGLRRSALVLDFGIGALARPEQDAELRRLTATNEALGSPTYAAPEQLRGESSTERTDLYSWGLVLLECLTGRPPFEGASLEHLLEHQLGPEPAKVPDALQRLPIHGPLARSIAKLPHERAASAEQLMELLQEAMLPMFPRASRAEAGASSQRLRPQQLTALSVRVRWRGPSPTLEEEQTRIRSFHEAVATAVGAHGGATISSMGSRVVALFGYPQAREQAARAALEAAATAREHVRAEAGSIERADVFAGVRSGSMLVPEDEASGPFWSPGRSGIVSGAMELEVRAAENEVWACDETRRLLRGLAVLEPAGHEDDLGVVDKLASAAAPIPAFRLGADLDRLRAPGISSTPMFGRDAELARLQEAWRLSQDGLPQAVLVAGDAGIGKSRLVRELRSSVDAARWIQCRCTPENENSPLQPIVEWLVALTRDVPLDEILRYLQLDVMTMHPLLSELIGAPFHPDYPQRAMPLQHKRDLTLNAILSLVRSTARREPVVFVVEDLHWADPSTRELLLTLVRELQSTAIFDTEPNLALLTVLTARSEFEPPWSLSEVPLVQLSRLPPRESEALAHALARGGAAIPETAIELLVQRADGVPLFLEEMARMAGEPASSDTADGVFSDPIPATLRDLLSVRIARLRSDVRSTVQVAACLGRAFDFPLLAAVSERSSENLREDLDALATAGLVFRRTGSRSGDQYVFHHVLLSDTARDSLGVHERRATHGRIAEKLSAPPFDQVAQLQPERLAYHFEQAEVLDRAIEFRQRAAMRAVASSSLREAIHHYDRALSLLGRLPESPERDHTELPLRIAKGSAHMMTEGHAAETVEKLFERALELCNRYTAAPQLFSTLNGLWAYNLVRGETDTIATLVARQQELAERSGSERRLLFARHAAGASAFLAGRFAEALPCLEEATQRLESASDARPSKPGTPAWQRQASNAPMYLAWCLHLMGCPDQAVAHAQRGLELAEGLDDIDAHVEAMTYLVALHHDRREPKQALELVDRIVPLAEEYGLVFWLGVAKASRGWARAQLGDVEPGVVEIREGLELFQRSGALVPLVYRACYLAEALWLAERPAEGLEAIDGALERSRGRIDRFFDAEAFRLRGELLFQDPGSDPARAESELRHAMELAAGQGALFLELRAATSLARHLVASGRSAEARATLAPIRGRFLEGTELPDLEESQGLLDSLEGDA